MRTFLQLQAVFGWDIYNGGSRMGHLGQMPPPPSLLPCGGATLLIIKILNFVKPRSAYITHKNMHILLQIKANQSQTNYEIVILHLSAH